MKYDVIIGLEIHAELNTKSKMFCSCLNDPFNSKANANTCPICLGHPGTLPLANKAAIEKTILLGLALNCQINRESKFDRKNYFYPDLPKGYQISQYDLPLAYKGSLEVNKQDIEITRIHLEEDTGKLNHPQGKNYTLIDFNRAGVPLVELVTEPVIRDGATAKMFCQSYQQILQYLDISQANMEKGEMRCELNISLQKKGTWERDDNGGLRAIKGDKLNNKVEVKNINSFKALEKAVKFEIERQSKLLDEGEEILKETRGCKDNGTTVSQRIKESSADYRYFPEPDILPLKIEEELITELKSQIGELPHKKQIRFIEQYRLSPDISAIITANKDLAHCFEKVISELREWLSSHKMSFEKNDMKIAKLTSNWISRDLIQLLSARSLSIKEMKLSSENFAELMLLIFQDKISKESARTILEIIVDNNRNPHDIMNELNLEIKEEDNEDLKNIVKDIIKENEAQFTDYKNGKEAILKYFIGKVMAQTKGAYKIDSITKAINSFK